MSDKQYACLAHEQSCAGCGSEGDQPLEWSGGTHMAFLFNSLEELAAFGRIGMCQKCQDDITGRMRKGDIG